MRDRVDVQRRAECRDGRLRRRGDGPAGARVRLAVRPRGHAHRGYRERATRRAGLDPALIAALSGHSMRIGAAQDMMVAGFDAMAIMQAGGWKSANVVLRYVENAATRELHEKRWARLNAAAR